MLRPITHSGLPALRDYRSRRVSSFDRSGGNRDWYDIEPGQTRVIAELDGPGCIRHMWCTMLFKDDAHLRRVVLRMFWDDCAEPSVECPIGDFFGLGHALRKNFHTAVLSMSPQDGRGFNSWWPMPFRRWARVEIDNRDGVEKFPFYFYVDYEQYDTPAALDAMGFFHVQWRRENPTVGWGEEYEELRRQQWQKWAEKTWHGGDPRSLNTSGADNYIILEALGDGIYCGAHLDIDIFERQKNDWYGEGDDMVWIDDDLADESDGATRRPKDGGKRKGRQARRQAGTKGRDRASGIGDQGSDGSDPATQRRSDDGAGPVGQFVTPRCTSLRPVRPPTLHGTGTEDWCNTAFGPHTEWVGPYHGILLYSGTDEWKWRGKQSIYRYYVLDPIRFRRCILATIEHGHANKLSNDYSSTAYYYLSRPRRGGPALPTVEQRLPRPDDRP